MSTPVLRLKADESFLETSWCKRRKTQKRGRAEKSELRDVKTANLIRNWRRSGFE